MSVLVRDRKQNILEAERIALDFATYTIHMCHNNKYFPKQERWTLATRLIDLCIDILTKIRNANAIRATTAKKANDRVNFQWSAVYNIRTLWTIMDIAYNVGHIPSEKMTTWCGLCNDMESKIIGWLRADVKKFKKEFGDGFDY